MTAGGFEGIGELFDGRRRITAADRLGAQTFQHGSGHFPISDPASRELFLSLVHVSILLQIRPLVQHKCLYQGRARRADGTSGALLIFRSVSGDRNL